jgi:hypothetical protein
MGCLTDRVIVSYRLLSSFTLYLAVKNTVVVIYQTKNDLQFSNEGCCGEAVIEPLLGCLIDRFRWCGRQLPKTNHTVGRDGSSIRNMYEIFELNPSSRFSKFCTSRRVLDCLPEKNHSFGHTSPKSKSGNINMPRFVLTIVVFLHPMMETGPNRPTAGGCRNGVCSLQIRSAIFHVGKYFKLENHDRF